MSIGAKRRRRARKRAEASGLANPAAESVEVPPAVAESVMTTGEPAGPHFPRGQGLETLSRSDMTLIRTAVANGYEFPAELLRDMPKAFGEMALDTERSDRKRVAAARVFATLVAQKMEQEKRDNTDGMPPVQLPAPPPQVNVTVGVAVQTKDPHVAILERYANVYDDLAAGQAALPSSSERNGFAEPVDSGDASESSS